MNVRKNKIRVGIIFGGRSAEHEVSLQSAKNVIDAIDKKKYEVVPIGINKNGRWFLNSSSGFLLNDSNPKLIKLNKESTKSLALMPGGDNHRLDAVFPILHGPYGEDGTMQGLLKLLDVPFVGPSVLGSALAMDKDVAKRLMRDAGIPVAKFLVFRKNEEVDFQVIQKTLGLPVFIKPANLGSSVGINKAKTQEEFTQAVSEAFKFDNKILVEEAVTGREIECA